MTSFSFFYVILIFHGNRYFGRTTGAWGNGELDAKMRILRAVAAVTLAILALPVSIIAGMGFKSRKCTPEELLLNLTNLRLVICAAGIE